MTYLTLVGNTVRLCLSVSLICGRDIHQLPAAMSLVWISYTTTVIWQSLRFSQQLIIKVWRHFIWIRIDSDTGGKSGLVISGVPTLFDSRIRNLMKCNTNHSIWAYLKPRAWNCFCAEGSEEERQSRLLPRFLFCNDLICRITLIKACEETHSERFFYSLCLTSKLGRKAGTSVKPCR